MLERPARIATAAAIVVVVLALLFRESTKAGPRVPPPPPEAPKRFVDETGLITVPHPVRMDEALGHILTESGVDFRMMIVPGLDGRSLEDFTLNTMRTQRIGHEVGGRGILVVIDAATRKARIEVGPPLQGTFPDAFVGYLLRDHLGPMFGGGRPELAVRTTMFMIHHRLRLARLGREYDPRFIQYVSDMRRLATGGGASTALRVRSEIAGLLTPSGDSATARYFSPQVTVEETYQRSIEALAIGLGPDYMPMYTEESRAVLARQPQTKGWADYLLAGQYGFQHAIDQRGELAMLFFTDTPFRSPLFFKRGPAGWQIDLAAEIRNSQEVVATIYTWRLRKSGDEYSRAFADRYQQFDGTGFGEFYRVAGGDNRAQCIRGRNPEPQGRGQPREACEAFAPLAGSMAYYTVQEAAAEIRATRGKPAVIVLYGTWNEKTRAAMPEIVRAAHACQRQGAVLRFYQFDYTRGSLADFPGFLATHRAPFNPAQLYPWSSGALGGAFRPLGIRIEATWMPPLAAVAAADGRIVWQRQGIKDWDEVGKVCGRNMVP